MRAVRGAEIALIFQEPMTALNPVFTDRRSDRGNAARARPRDAARREERRRSSCSSAVRIPDPASARRRLSAPAVGRHAAARADRDGARLPAVARHRRRADDGARRHDSGADPRPAARDESGVQPVAAAHHPRPRRHRRDGRPRRGHVRRPHRRARAGARDLPRRRSIPYTRGLLASMPGGGPGQRLRAIEGIGAAARRAAARLRVSSRAARIASSRARRRRRRTIRSGRSRRRKCYLHDPTVRLASRSPLADPAIRDAAIRTDAAR